MVSQWFPEATARSSFAPSGLWRLPASASGLARSWLRYCLQAVSDPRSQGPGVCGATAVKRGEAASPSGYAEFLVQMLGACKHSWLVHIERVKIVMTLSRRIKERACHTEHAW